MSQNPLMDSGMRSLKTPGLKPALAAALGSLEVQLDQELARYRRSRMGVRANSQPSVHSYVSNPPQDVTPKNTTVGNTQPPTVEIRNYTTPTPAPDIPPEPAVPTNSQTETPKPTQVSTHSASNTQIPLPPPNAATSIVPTTTTTNQNHKLLADDTPPQPNDYLESSEALLRSLTDEDAPADNQPSNSSDSLLSPLGIGSMLLLLLASLTLGYVILNPKSLPQFNLSQLINSNPSSSTENPEAVGTNVPPQPQPELTPIPKYPNLAAQEFPEVRDPNDVVGLQPKVQPTPAIPPSNPLTQVQPLPPVNVSPIPTLQPLPPSPDTPTPPNAEIKPAADGRYYIVTDNQGASSLAAVRQVVPDASLSNNNQLIYLGVLKTKEEAQQRLKELQAKGIKARIQSP